MSLLNPRSLPCLALVGLLAAAACVDSPAAPGELDDAPALASALDGHGPQHTFAHLGPDMGKWVRSLRRETRPFKRFAAAAPGGYVAKLSDCVESPAGGMGYHYGNPALIDGRLDPLQPEILLYEPRRDGRLRFVGVEFIVPFPAWTDDQPPQVNGIPLHRNEALGLWVLHVWTQRHNPTGILEDFNPRVSCRFAPTGEAA